MEFKKVGELNLHCGECELIDHCGELWSDIAICMERRMEEIDIRKLYNALETAKDIIPGGISQDRIDEAYNILNR